MSGTAVEYWGAVCGQRTNSGGTRRMSGQALARRFPQGIELPPRPPGDREAGRLGDEGPHDTSRLAGAWRSGWVTRPLGPQDPRASTGSVTGTGHPKGPCDSYSQGPFTHFRVRPPRSSRGGRVRLLHRRGSSNPLNHGENSSSSVDDGRRSVEHRANFGGTESLFAEPLARPVPEGIQLLPRTPAREDEATRRRGSRRRRASLLGTRRGGGVTVPPGPEWTRCRSGSVTSTGHRRALGTHTSEGPSPISAGVRQTRR